MFQVTGEKTCFNHTVKRWFPVANMTQYRQALMYESYARGELTSLYHISIFVNKYKNIDRPIT